MARGRGRVVRFAALVAVAALAASCSGSTSDGAAKRPTRSGATTSTAARGSAGGEVAPIRRDGRWFVDPQGRVVQLRGVNEVYKSAPFYPAADGFGPDDVAFLTSQGFNTVRLGVNFEGLMPEPGQIDEGYLDGLATTVDDLSAGGMYVLLDFHQDGYSPKYNGNGFPDWMALDDGLENPPDAVFPLYYAQNPAMQRAWEGFWSNRKGPGGVGIQDRFLAGLDAVVSRFADEPQVIGYETINEPFPGKDWASCAAASGCGPIEAKTIAPFAAKVEATVAAHTSTQQVWVEPFVLFNFGKGPTSLIGADGDALLAVHSYALDVAGEDGVVDQAVAAGERDGKPVLVTEFGASVDPVLNDRLADGFDRGMLPWLFWAYNENIMSDRDGDASVRRANDLAGLKSLVRPYPVAVAGTPTGWSYDAETRAFDLAYEATGPDGEDLPDGVDSEVFVPELNFPDGYVVTVTGGTTTSPPCAPRLTIATNDGAAKVVVHIEPPTERQAHRTCGS